MSTNRSYAARETATAVAVDPRALGVVVINVGLLSLALIAGAEWLRVP